MKISKVNNVFRGIVQCMVNHRITVSLCFVALCVLALMGTKQIYFQTSWDSYFVEGDPMLKQTDEFKSIFGNDYYVAVLARNDEGLFTKQSLGLIRELSQELMDSLSYSEKITSLTDLEFMVGSEEGMTLEQIVPDEIPSDKMGLEAIRRKAYSKPYVASRLLSKDGTMTWIMLKLRPFPEDSVWKAEGAMAPDMLTGMEADRILRNPKYAPLHLKGAGMPYMSYQKTNYISDAMRGMMVMAVISCLIIMAVSTRTLRGIVTPIFTSVCSILIAYGIIGWLHLYLDQATSMVVILLSFAVSVAYNVHLYNSYRSYLLKLGNRRQAVVESVAETGWPVFLSGLTTIAAMMTFLAMNIVPMKAMGVNAAISILCVLVSCIFVTPILFSLGRDKKLKRHIDDTPEGRIGAMFSNLGAWVVAHRKPIGITTCVATLLCAVGLYRIEPAFDVERTMGVKVDYVRNFLELCNTELGSMYAYDMMVVLPNKDDAKNPDNLRRLEKLEKVAEGYKLTKRTKSVLDIIKDMNCTLNSNDSAFYALPDDKETIAQQLLLYENAGGSESEYWMDYDYRRLRLQIELKGYNSNEAELEMNDLQEKARELFPTSTVSVVGNIPQFTVMQQYIEKGQMWSMLLSVGIIGVLLMLVFGNWKLGLISMLPNLAPAVIVGGLMGWLDYPLDMMTACIIPMVLGIAVDDTIHIINHTHLEYERTGNYTTSICSTFRVAGMSVVMSTVIISAVFAGFMSASATQFRNFGMLAIIGMLSALLVDLFVTPLLIKYLRVFGREKKCKN